MAMLMHFVQNIVDLSHEDPVKLTLVEYLKLKIAS